MPVVDRRGRLVGLVSERDVLEAMYPNRPELRSEKRGKRRVHRQIRDIRRLPVRDVMIREVVTAPPDADPLRLASLLAIRRIRRIPIVEDGKLVGIVSQGDVYQAIFQKDWRPVRQHPVPDGREREDQAEVKKSPTGRGPRPGRSRVPPFSKAQPGGGHDEGRGDQPVMPRVHSPGDVGE
ncbi:MAG: CBS domain-containing protein [Candidatus Methylomirabilales bacterium]